MTARPNPLIDGLTTKRIENIIDWSGNTLALDALVVDRTLIDNWPQAVTDALEAGLPNDPGAAQVIATEILPYLSLDTDFASAVADALTGSRIYISTSGNHIVDAENKFPAVHFIEVNGTVDLDVTSLATYQTYAISTADFTTMRVNLWAGYGVTFVGTAVRDGFTASDTLLLRGGESVLLCKITGNKIVVLGHTVNLDATRIFSTTDLRFLERLDGRVDVWHRRTIAAGTSTFVISHPNLASGGYDIDFTQAVIGGISIIEDTATARDPIKVRVKGNDGSGSGQLTVENPNGLSLSCEILILDVELI